MWLSINKAITKSENKHYCAEAFKYKSVAKHEHILLITQSKSSHKDRLYMHTGAKGHNDCARVMLFLSGKRCNGLIPLQQKNTIVFSHKVSLKSETKTVNAKPSVRCHILLTSAQYISQ